MQKAFTILMPAIASCRRAVRDPIVTWPWVETFFILFPSFCIGYTERGRATAAARESFQSRLTMTAPRTIIVRLCFNICATASDVDVWMRFTSLVSLAVGTPGDVLEKKRTGRVGRGA